MADQEPTTLDGVADEAGRDSESDLASTKGDQPPQQDQPQEEQQQETHGEGERQQKGEEDEGLKEGEAVIISETDDHAQDQQDSGGSELALAEGSQGPTADAGQQAGGEGSDTAATSTETSPEELAQDDAQDLGNTDTKVTVQTSGRDETFQPADKDQSDDMASDETHEEDNAGDAAQVEAAPDATVSSAAESDLGHEVSVGAAVGTDDGPLALATSAERVDTAVGDSFKPDPLTQAAQARRDDKQTSTSPLALEWTYGFTCDVPSLCLSLETERRQDVFFVSGHVGVIYDAAIKRQDMLEGHYHAICAVAVSGSKRWLVTGDSGPDATMFVWDTEAARPVQTVFNDQIGLGVNALAISVDGLYVISVTQHDNGQRVAVWDWSAPEQPCLPLCAADVPDACGRVVEVACHPDNPRLVAITGTKAVGFGAWELDSEVLQVFLPEQPELSKHEQFVASAFVGERGRVLSATSSGKVAVWATARVDDHVDVGDAQNVASKLFVTKTTQATPTSVRCMASTPDGTKMVLGGGDGNVHFYDQDMRVLGSQAELDFGEIMSISFADEESQMVAHDVGITPETLPSVVPNFVLATTEGALIHVVGGAEFSPSVVMRSLTSGVRVAQFSPTSDRLAIASASGGLQLWDSRHHELLASRSLQSPASCMRFSPDGNTLAVGLMDGKLFLLDSISLRLVKPTTKFHESKRGITHIAFSNDAAVLATADEARCISLYQLLPADLEEPWHFVHKCRSHAKAVTGLLFSRDGNLMSVGKDRVLVRYDVAASLDAQYIQPIKPAFRVDQLDEPTALELYPAEIKGQNFVVVGNTGKKFRLYNADTALCRRIVQGPLLPAPAERLALVPRKNQQQPELLAFFGGNFLGLALCPLDGNPHRYTAVVAHPRHVSDMSVSHDGSSLVTCESTSACPHQWKVNGNALQASCALGGQGFAPFAKQLEAETEDGDLLNTIKDYFYYAQVRKQSYFSTERRQVTDRIPVSDVADVMRAIGFFPTQQQITDMLTEVKFSRYEETNQEETSVDVEQLVRLYLNHKPSNPMTINDIVGMWQAAVPEGSMSRQQLLNMLTTTAEAMDEEELVSALISLEVDPDVPFNPDTLNLPERVTTGTVNELLGFVANDSYEDQNLA